MIHLPHFLVIGAQKTGTKWLYWNLQNQPDIYLPWGGGEEVHYFDGPYCGDHQWYSDHWRPRGKSNWTDNTLLGDITPDYAILSEKAIQGVHSLIPNAKILYILRNPKQRVISHIRMAIKKTLVDYAGEPRGPMIKKYDILERLVYFCEYGLGWDHSDYVNNITRWKKLYGDQLYILSYDMLRSYSEKFLCVVLEEILEIRIPLKNVISERYHVSIPYPIHLDLLPELDRIYDPEIEKLADMVDFDISSWKRPAV